MKRKIISLILTVMFLMCLIPGSAIADDSITITPNDEISYDNDYISREIFGYKGNFQRDSFNLSTSDIPLAWDPEAIPVHVESKTVGEATYALYVYEDGSYSTTTSSIVDSYSIRATTYTDLSFSWNNIGGGGAMGIVVRISVNESTGEYRISSVSKGRTISGSTQNGVLLYTYVPGSVGIKSSTVAWREFSKYVYDGSTCVTTNLGATKKYVKVIWDSDYDIPSLREYNS